MPALTSSDSDAGERQMGLLWIFPNERPHFVEVREPLTFGRSPSCDVVLDDESVSRCHVRVRRHGPILIAEDQASRNGVYHDGRRVRETGLAHGAVLRIGAAIAIAWDAPSSTDLSSTDLAFRELLPGWFGGSTLAARTAELPRVARSSLSIVLQGETGTGKEGAAAAIHALSGRHGRLVAVNCATLSPELAGSQLFGHRRGAFSGATCDTVGYLAAAHLGTLFLDEVAELPLDTQAQLLRALQQQEYVPLGQTEPRAMDVRVVVSTPRALGELVHKGAFRADLHARLAGYTLALPALRERREDIPFLLKHFLARELGGPTPALDALLVEALCVYRWPMNVRELSTLAKRWAVLHAGLERLGTGHLPSEIATALLPCKATPHAVPPNPATEFLRALAESRGNVMRAARQLGISRARAYRLMSEAGFDARTYRQSQKELGRTTGDDNADP